MHRSDRSVAVPAMVLTLLVVFATECSHAQPAPIPRLVVPADAAPEAVGDLFQRLESGESSIEMEGAAWLQLQLADFQLGPNGTLTISTEAGQSQTFTQDQLEDWGGLTAIFNGSKLKVTLQSEDSDEIFATIKEIVVGLPGEVSDGPEAVAPEPLRDLLGDDLDRFRPEDLPRQPEGSSEESPEDASEDSGPETICPSQDNRSGSSHPLIGRIMPIGCTGWIIRGGALLTAGHCIGSATTTIEFNVPASLSNGTTISPPIRDQYRIVADSIVDGFTGTGNDWAVFRVLPNTETGDMPMEAQGGAFQLSQTAQPINARITGFGVDGPPPFFGSPLPRNADNQTQQTHSGNLASHSVGGVNLATLGYVADTQGGNSGSPVIADGSGNLAIGIHTNGGCSAAGGTNKGTSFRNQALWSAIVEATRVQGDINGDGLSDLSFHKPLPGSTWNTVPVLLSDGDGTWTAHNNSAPTWAHQAGVVTIRGDFNGDGHSDMAFHKPLPGSTWNTVPVLLSDGDGTWTAHNTPAPTWAHQPGVVAIPGDFNGDGHSDMAFHKPLPGSTWNTVPVLLSDGDGTWTAHNTSAPTWAHQAGVVAIPGDFNSDGHSDVAFHKPLPGSTWNTVPVLLSDGDGTWTAHNTSAPTWAHQVGAVAIPGDFNGDGHSDVAFHKPLPGSTWNTVPVLLSDGDGTWTAHNNSAPTWAHQAGAVAIPGDFNGDGHSDVAFHKPLPGSTWSTVPVLLSDGDGTWTAHNTSAPTWAHQAGAVAIPGDFNGDGHSDVAFHKPLPGSTWNTVPVLLSDGDGTWTAHNNSAPTWAHQAGVVGASSRSPKYTVCCWF